MYTLVKRDLSSFDAYLHFVLNPDASVEITEADPGALGYGPYVAIHSFDHI